MSELNKLIRYGLKETYEKYYNYIEVKSNYCLYFINYDFSILLNLEYLDKNNSKIYIYTLKPKLSYYKDDIVIKLNTTL